MTIFVFITTVLHLYLHYLHLYLYLHLHLHNLHLYLPNLHLYYNVLEKSTFLYYYIFKELNLVEKRILISYISQFIAICPLRTIYKSPMLE